MRLPSLTGEQLQVTLQEIQNLSRLEIIIIFGNHWGMKVWAMREDSGLCFLRVLTIDDVDKLTKYVINKMAGTLPVINGGKS